MKSEMGEKWKVIEGWCSFVYIMTHIGGVTKNIPLVSSLFTPIG